MNLLFYTVIVDSVLELLNALCDANIISSLIRVGHTRGCMAQVLQLLVERRSNTRLSSSDVAYLVRTIIVHMYLLCVCLCVRVCGEQ